MCIVIQLIADCIAYRLPGLLNKYLGCSGVNGFVSTIFKKQLLNQARAGLWPVRAWFLKIDPVRIVGMHVCVCVCPRPRLLITSGMMWHDMNLIRLVKQVLQLLYGNYSRYR